MRKPLILTVSILATALAALAQQPPIDPAAVDRIMTTALETWRIPGASVAIVKDDRIVYVKAYGTKEIGRNDPV
ncbi:MAG TPA: hypothetical protein VEZ11_13360, partial [Thermoanaerobaculia bacterium]|nr:hypothetical protein [Thermoanaerobaculia bacterium]